MQAPILELQFPSYNTMDARVIDLELQVISFGFSGSRSSLTGR